MREKFIRKYAVTTISCRDTTGTSPLRVAGHVDNRAVWIANPRNKSGLTSTPPLRFWLTTSPRPNVTPVNASTRRNFACRSRHSPPQAGDKNACSAAA